MKKSDKIEKQSKMKSAGMTLAFMGLILVSLIFVAFKSPTKEERPVEGMIIDFGYDDTGSGNNESQNQASNPSAPSPTAATEKQDVATQDVEEAVSVPKQNPKQNTHQTTTDVKTNTTTKTETTQQTKINKDEVFDPSKLNKNNTDNNSKGGDGPGTGPGNQGDPNGDPNGGLGGVGNNPNSSGIGYDLTGRSMVSKPVIDGTPPEPGKVVLKISVDKNGVVRSATYERMGSTITDQSTINKAIASVKGKKLFDLKNDAPDAQEGYITIKYSFK